jgi:hypothetical protein
MYLVSRGALERAGGSGPTRTIEPDHVDTEDDTLFTTTSNGGNSRFSGFAQA